MDSVVHFEIPASNVGRAKKFYGSIFGWKTENYPAMDYTILHTVETDRKTMKPKQPGAINGGMMKRMGAIKAPVVTINVADIDKAMQKVTKAGGKVVMPKQKVMEMGWNAYVMDTEGNVIGVWQNATPMPPK